MNILFLHGFMGSHADWDPVIGQLPAGLQCVAPDLHEHMNTMPLLAENLIELCGEGLLLVGYSMGARLAIYLAIHFPERIQHAIIISGSAGLEAEDERRQRRMSDNKWIEKLRSLPAEQFLDEWYAQPIFTSRPQRQPRDPEILVQALQQMGLAQQPSLWRELSTCKVPMTFMCGARDEKFVKLSTRMHESCPNSRLVVADNSGHDVLFEQPALIAQQITNKVRRQS